MCVCVNGSVCCHVSIGEGGGGGGERGQSIQSEIKYVLLNTIMSNHQRKPQKDM